MLPDILGFDLDEGIRVLRDAGYSNLSVRHTQSPRNRQDNCLGNNRIVKMIQTETETIELIACRIENI